MVTLRPPRANEHEFLWKLRQANDVYFFSESGDLASHICWYKRVESDPFERFYAIDVQGQAVGTVSLSNINMAHGQVEYGRLCVGEAHRRKGYATAAMQAVLDIAFNEMGAHRVWGDIFAFNKEAITLDLKLGFRQEGTFRDHVMKSCMYLNVVRMAILEDEWRSHNAGL